MEWDDGALHWDADEQHMFRRALLDRYEEMSMTIMEHVNGTRPKGRQAPPLGEHTFRDSGITIKIRKVGPTTQQRAAQAIQREMPEPQPPIVETELGPESNAADPAYASAYMAWQQKTNQALTDRLMLLAALEAEVAIDEEVRAQITRKKHHLELAGIPYEDNPKLNDEENARVFFVLQIACATPDDLAEFGQAVLRRSVPTEEAVARHIATFPGDLPGPGSVQLPPDPALGDSV